MTGVNVEVTPVHATITVGIAEAAVSTGKPVVKEYEEREPFEGAYKITPNGEIQILETKNLRMTDNVTIDPIPQNYGLITWNGSFLTVS